MRLHPISLAFVLPAWLLLLISTTQAQALPGGASLSDLPQCATQCLVGSANSTTCQLLDFACVCRDEHFLDVVTECIVHGCTVKESLVAKNFTATVCLVPVRDKSQLLANIYIIFGAIAGTMVLARLVFKAAVLRVGWAMDDWFILMTTSITMSKIVLAAHGACPNGLGRDIWTLTPQHIGLFAKYFYILEVLYIAELTLLKMSLLFFYLHIFPATPVRRLLWGTIAFNAAYGTTFVLVGAFQCRPVSFAWLGWDGEHKGTCLSVNKIAWAHAAISISLDLWMLAIPLSQLRTLKLHWKKKLGVGLMFFVGTFVTVVSILRLQALLSFANSSNPTWDNWDTTNWSAIEVNIGIICATLPTARLMLKRFFPAIMGTTRNTKGYYYRGGEDDATGRKWGGGTNRSANLSSVVAGGGPGTADETKKGGNIIVHKQTFTVQYAQAADDDGRFGVEQDEQRLVRMRDLDRRGRGLETRSEISERSEGSL